MELEKLPPETRFVFIAMMKSAIMFRHYGYTKEVFVTMAEEIWNSMELNNEEDLEMALSHTMRHDLERFKKEYLNDA